MASSPNSSGITDPSVNVTSLLSTGNKLTKEYSVSDGDLHKEYPGTIYQGYAYRDCVPLSKIAEGITKATSHHALCPGVCHHDVAAITVKGRDKPDEGLYARSKEHFKFEPNLPALVIFDYDPDVRGFSLSSPGELLKVVGAIHSSVTASAHVLKPSASAGIRYADTNDLIAPTQGFHIYLPALDGSDIPRYMDVLFKRLVLAGYGHIKISKSGSLLVRTIIDGAIKSPERIDYVAPAIIGQGLVRDPVLVQFVPGGYLDTSTLLNLTEEEESTYQSIVDTLKIESSDQAMLVRNQYAKQKAADTGHPIQEVLEALKQSDKGYLTHTQLLVLNDGSSLLVKDVFSNPKGWHCTSMRDPFEQEKGPDKAMLFCNEDGSIVLHSFVGGEHTYKLQNKPVSLYAGINRVSLDEAEKQLATSCNQLLSSISTTDEVSLL